MKKKLQNGDQLFWKTSQQLSGYMIISLHIVHWLAREVRNLWSGTLVRTSELGLPIVQGAKNLKIEYNKCYISYVS